MCSTAGLTFESTVLSSTSTSTESTFVVLGVASRVARSVEVVGSVDVARPKSLFTAVAALSILKVVYLRFEEIIVGVIGLLSFEGVLMVQLFYSYSAMVRTLHLILKK